MGKLRRAVIRNVGLKLLALGTALPFVGCGGGDVQSPTTGQLDITTATTGPELDTDGYTVSIDGGAESAIGVSATMEQEGLESGSHSVQLAAMASNCTVAGDNPRSVNISAGATGTVTFEVTCSATSGSLQISVATSGAASDPDGYAVSIDGADRGTLAVNGSLTVDGLMPGNHTVGLGGLAATCQLAGDNPRIAAVTPGASTPVAFAITCVAPEPGTGSIQITTTTTGADPDVNGYAYALDGGAKQVIAANATVAVANVGPGAHALRLSGVAANCAIEAGNSRSITVIAGTTEPVSFAVTCRPTSGGLTITTGTTGSTPDPDGYTVSVDGGAAQPIEVNGTVSVLSLGAGTHRVTLAGVAGNCKVQGTNPLSVDVPGGSIARAAFSIECSVPAVTRWRSMVTGTTGYFTNVSGSSGTDVFAVHENGGIWHYDGTAWSSQPAPVKAAAVWANSSADAVAIRGGGLGTFLHYNGQQWLADAPPPAPPEFELYDFGLAAIWGSSATDVWAVGDRFYVFDPENFDYDVAGYVAHYDGTSWSSSRCCGDFLTDVWGISSNDVYLVGYNFPSGDSEADGSFVSHYDGVSWSTIFEQTGFDQQFSQVWASSASDIYVIQETNQRLWHFDGTKWSIVNAPLPGVWKIWGSAADDVYLLTGGQIWHFDGRTWKKVYTGKLGLSDIWGSSASDVFVVGENGTILHGTP